MNMCGQACRWNHPTEGCLKPIEVICPLANCRSVPERVPEKKTVSILGVQYTIEELSEAVDERLKDCDGYCDWTTKKIVVEREANGTLDDMGVYMRKVLRHEIVHAFLLESGLHECSGSTDAWAANEAAVDWIARQGQKIYKAWEQTGALDHTPAEQ